VSAAVVSVVNRAVEAPALRARQPLSLCPELDCIRSILPPGVIVAAERRSIAIGVGAERVLIASGAISEEQYVVALARYLGVAFEPLDRLPRDACPMNDGELLSAPTVGMLSLQQGGDIVAVVAPRNMAARRLCFLNRSVGLPHRVHLTTSARLQRFVDRHCAKAIACKAADDLKTRHPYNSAAHRFRRAWTSRIVPILSLAAVICIAPTLIQGVAAIGLGCVFFAWTALRFAAAVTDDDFAGDDPAVLDHDLPVYTILVALSVAARRHIQSLSHRCFAQDRSVGSLQRHRGCRSRHAAVAAGI
jgi:hypothetical protein